MGGPRARKGARARVPARGDTPADEQLRARICQECARIMAEEGVRDFQLVKRKASARLNVKSNRYLPSNVEIDDSLHDYLRLFHAEALGRNLHRCLSLAREVMRNLDAFKPRAVGPLLRGTVTDHSPLELHVFADTPEELNWFLADAGIPFETADKRLRFGGDRYRDLPVVRFTVDDTKVEIVVFSREAIREAPLSPVDGRPMARARLREVEEMAAAL
jgi:hypothetical protein